MKKLTKLLHCISKLLKKKFFNEQKNDIYHECAEVPLVNRMVEEEDQKETEEYLANYNSTTRWQTV